MASGSPTSLVLPQQVKTCMVENELAWAPPLICFKTQYLPRFWYERTVGVIQHQAKCLTKLKYFNLSKWRHCIINVRTIVQNPCEPGSSHHTIQAICAACMTNIFCIDHCIYVFHALLLVWMHSKSREFPDCCITAWYGHRPGPRP